MNILTAFGLLVALGIGAVVGWLLHASRMGDRAVRAEAQLAALREHEGMLRQSLSAVNEDSARRNSTVIGQQVSHLVEPLHDAVDALSEHVRQVEHNRIRAYAGLSEQVTGMHRASMHLSTQTAQLVTALRAPQIRGRWGEIQLERVVELAGMVKHCDFDTQVSKDGIRPDMIVRLAGGRQIVVDAKVPFAAYLDAAQDEDPAAREKNLRRHAKQLRTHIDQLADKAYWQAFEPTPEFVVLFVPGDPFLDAALTSDTGLLEYAFGRNVILATPTTLVALLRTVAYTWKQESLAEDAARIQQLGRELYTRIGVVSTHLDKLGAHLGKAVESFNSTVGSVDTRVSVTARKLHELELFDADPVDIARVDERPKLSDSSRYRHDFGHVSDAVG
ncbi:MULTISPECIES: DNA recombination protein RmuC [Rhodococcus]|jgi:DNA recombination protein RmuC|uniref:DNA recombination protein RmuC n=1 Tax=Rhodococcus cercidiphylli TaxID=489916 RepID=A0ABU4AYM6_9NOCA|nr:MULTISPECIES: DNA recombination protein RmuC [Rhodococcus]MDI6629848.1 DNA recombination protein RmuC [Rhodococcus sp. (in: high G+C Gram-positive bacteria)]MDV6231342.1 DNA recombination protein RmuC [Rhodococcus cercidiphylli]MDV7991135.1 DNA recombination protein RmuC [Rhodococcus sp. IEGM 1374]